MLTVRNLRFVSGPGQAGMTLNEGKLYKIPNGLDQYKITITNRTKLGPTKNFSFYMKQIQQRWLRNRSALHIRRNLFFFIKRSSEKRTFCY